MKCDDVLAKLETGHVVDRLSARFHVRRCSECQRAYRQLAEFKRSLAHTEPIRESDRRRWFAATGTEPPDRVTRRALASPRWAYAILATAAVILVAIGIRLTQKNRSSDRIVRGPTAPQSEVKSSDISGTLAWQELADVREGMAELGKELAELSGRVELLDEEKEVDDVLSRLALHRES